MSVHSVLFAIYLAIALYPGLVSHEYAHALVADRLGDHAPRNEGRLTLNPKAHIDTFGSVVLPGLLLAFVAVGVPVVPFAYAKPMPQNPFALKNPNRDSTLIALAGSGANLAMAVVAGLILRAVPAIGQVHRFVLAWLFMNLILCVFNLMPIPGLDGARIIARYLPPRAREVYTNLDQYLVLFMLVIFFLLGAPVIAIVNGLTGALCQILAGAGCSI